MACEECTEEKIRKEVVYRTGTDIKEERTFHKSCAKCRELYRITLSDTAKVVKKIIPISLPPHKKNPDYRYFTYQQGS